VADTRCLRSPNSNVNYSYCHFASHVYYCLEFDLPMSCQPGTTRIAVQGYRLGWQLRMGAINKS
jgi:hypothetical protein